MVCNWFSEAIQKISFLLHSEASWAVGRQLGCVWLSNLSSFLLQSPASYLLRRLEIEGMAENNTLEGKGEQLFKVIFLLFIIITRAAAAG
uniref:Uncharacterized protein n=1 Tax=Ditylenchus dipsaci TaxID=166011 RepID=A0A915ETD8_9BILA